MFFHASEFVRLSSPIHSILQFSLPLLNSIPSIASPSPSMSLAINLTPHCNRTLPSRHHFQGIHDFSHMMNGSVLLPSYLAKLNNTHMHQSLHRRPFLSKCSSNADGLSEEYKHEGLVEREENKKGFPTMNEILEKLRRYGVSGILSYGLLNTAYYVTAFLFMWLYVDPSPGKLGYLASVERFLKVIALVWAGSQVTKLARAAGALAMAPFVERGLSWFTVNFKFQSQFKAFMTIVAFCFGFAIFFFLVITTLWA